MKIAINCIYYTQKGGGIKEYIYNLVKNISIMDRQNSYVFYITKDYKQSFQMFINKTSKVKIFPYGSNQKIKRSIFQQKFWYNEEKRENFDIFHSPFFHAPNFKKAKVILTVHDLRFLRYPLSYRIPRYIYLKYVVKNSLINAKHIITVSNFTKDEIIDCYKISPEKVDVIPEAVDFTGFSLKNDSATLIIEDKTIVRKKYFLAVGHLEPRKNYLRLIEAYSNLPDKLKNKYALVIVGKKNHGYKKIIDAINHSRMIFYFNFVSRDELSWLYANSKIHVFPSFYEGFGFPSLEAGLFGIPTIGANNSSIAEVAGKGGIYFNPFSLDEIVETITKVLTNTQLYEQLSKEALKNIRLFSWKDNALKTIDVYKSFK